MTVAQTMSIQPEFASHGPLPPHLEAIVAGFHPSLDVKGRVTLTDLLHKYIHLFPAPSDPVTGRTQAARHEIETHGALPVQCRPRRLAPMGLRKEWGRQQWFSTINLTNEYWQLAMSESGICHT